MEEFYMEEDIDFSLVAEHRGFGLEPAVWC